MKQKVKLNKKLNDKVALIYSKQKKKKNKKPIGLLCLCIIINASIIVKQYDGDESKWKRMNEKKIEIFIFKWVSQFCCEILHTHLECGVCVWRGAACTSPFE